ncbi:MAG: tRNA lysidine(34) synthetase TilS [Planctomycetota bacterium]
MNWDSFLNQVRAWLEARKLLGHDLSWVVGVSGGPDSTLLLHAMKELSERGGLGWRLAAAHLHHGLRGSEADADAVYARELADELNVPLHAERIDIPGEVERRGGSTEEVARNRRYEFLERVALKTGSELIAVAHHADDNAETVLHRICRGTGLRGLAGIRDVRAVRPDSHIRVVRPFLAQRRATIEALCRQRGLPVRTDSTNRSQEFTRGRVRQTVMPLLVDLLNPNVAEALLRLSEQARLLGTYLEDAGERTFESLLISHKPNEVILNVRGLLGKQRIIQAEVVRRAVSVLLGREQDVGFGHVEAILHLADDPASGKEVHVAGPVCVRKQYDRLEFRPLTDAEPPPELGIVFVTCPGRTPLPALGFTVTAEVRPVDTGTIEEIRRRNNPLEQWLDHDSVRPPLLIRGRREGDRFHPLGSPGAKTVGDFFGEQKIAPEVRARTGILCDQEGPLWVIPLRIDERVKLRPTTRRAIYLALTPTSALFSAGPAGT